MLEDNPFYNQVLSTRLKLYAETMLVGKSQQLAVESYVDAGVCLANIKPDTDIVFMDFYLSDNLTALDVMRQIRWRCPKAKIIIMSQYFSLNNSIASILEGASGFIQKGVSAIPKTCDLLKQTFLQKQQVT